MLNTPIAAGHQMDTNKKMRETISSFMDGELPDADTELALAGLRERDGVEAWCLYHRIGDALRAEPGTSALSSGFAARLANRLDAEPLPLRREARKPELPAGALASIAPAVIAGGRPRTGATAEIEPALEHDAPPQTKPAAKRM
ncbi:sigma-E factor negative regulatory protein [Massilia sp. H6]|uniref:sigma-E factor negative regulatory protein n=1 Tax=Massilia sp. H6 TaxID=2970464 RepID=UPI002169C7CF|nr:sigma-E factor negative regulatory protein [Massilia sp. H6]UVW27427.1 sigma-E factor negative regulatory protein [Massilia sp. H6]